MKAASLLRCIATVQVILSVSCAAPGVRESSRPLAQSPLLAALLHADKLTPDTQAHLKEQQLDRLYRKDPAEAIAQLHKRLISDPSRTHHLALIELYSDTGDQLAARSPQTAIGYHLAAAELAFHWAGDSYEEALKRRELVAAYNHACGQVVRSLSHLDYSWNEPIEFEHAGKTYRLRCRTTGSDFVNPAFFDAIVPAEYLKFENIEFKRIRRDGVGAALVGHRTATAERRDANPYLPPVGMALPINATLDFSPAGSAVELAFHDLLICDETDLGGRRVPLAADLTAPLATLFNFRKDRKIGINGLRNPEDYLENMGLYQLEPFREDQIPVVFVHGLMSSPETWVRALNRFRSDPLLRKKYQLYVFRYPTGFPIAYNAAALRRRLAEFQDDHDPARQNPRMREAILIGHSMGGMLSNMQIRNSGDTLTRLFFDRPIDELNELKDVQKTAVKELLIFNSNTDVTRAVFVASPHRGSQIASSPIGRLGSRLIKFPMKAITVEPLPAIEGMTDAGREIIKNRPDSIFDLQPDSPSSLAILSMPVGNGIAIHSIIGRDNPNHALQESSDKVVPYVSAHLDEAISEKVVEADHTSITGNLEAIEELRRILYLHAGLPYRSDQVAN